MDIRWVVLRSNWCWLCNEASARVAVIGPGGDRVYARDGADLRRSCVNVAVSCATAELAVVVFAPGPHGSIVLQAQAETSTCGDSCQVG